MSDELDRHLDEWHSYDREALAEMFEVVPQITMMIDDFYGELHPVVGDPSNREGGRLEKYDAAVEVIENGGMKVKLPAGAWAAIVALISTLGLIAVAVINIAFGSG
jgi:hypothetical protein